MPVFGTEYMAPVQSNTAMMHQFESSAKFVNQSGGGVGGADKKNKTDTQTKTLFPSLTS